MAFFTKVEPIQPMEKMTFQQPAADMTQGKSFSGILKAAVSELEQAQAQAQQDSMMLAAGQIDDLAAVQINSMKASTMLQTTVQLTTRAVNAYKDIMQMQV